MTPEEIARKFAYRVDPAQELDELASAIATAIRDALRDYEAWRVQIYQSEPLGADQSVERYLAERNET